MIIFPRILEDPLYLKQGTYDFKADQERNRDVEKWKEEIDERCSDE